MSKIITYQEAEELVNKAVETVNCGSLYQGEWFKAHLSEVVAIFPEVREHLKERIRMLEIYKEKGLL